MKKTNNALWIAAILLAAVGTISLLNSLNSLHRQKLATPNTTVTNYVTITNYMTVESITVPIETIFPPPKPRGTGYFILIGQGEYYRKDFQ